MDKISEAVNNLKEEEASYTQAQERSDYLNFRLLYKRQGMGLTNDWRVFPTNCVAVILGGFGALLEKQFSTGDPASAVTTALEDYRGAGAAAGGTVAVVSNSSRSFNGGSNQGSNSNSNSNSRSNSSATSVALTESLLTALLCSTHFEIPGLPNSKELLTALKSAHEKNSSASKATAVASNDSSGNSSGTSNGTSTSTSTNCSVLNIAGDVSEFVRLSLLAHLRGLVKRVGKLFPYSPATTLHCITILLR
jgi:hypothetical protein